ncbi:MAG: potassium channel protein [Planctomycetales bacterium]|nr:potassium channel protein [Planctomycetales bacterium]
MKTSLERIRQGASILVAVALVSVVGYRLLTGSPWLESIYWFVITVSSVGYTEESNIAPSVQAFSIGVIVFGMCAAAYTIGGFLQMVTEGEIDRALGIRRLTRDIRRLSDHVIICGFGRIGQFLAADLASQHTPFLVIDRETDLTLEAQGLGYLCIHGDATDEEILLAAGVERAKCLVSGLPNDAENVFITLTARNLNSSLQIIARGEQPNSEKKLRQAGADRVVMTAIIGAKNIGRMIMRPHTADLLDLVSDRHHLDAEVDEIRIPENCSLVGKTVADAETHRKHQLLVIAARRSGGQMVFNPGANHRFEPNDTIIVMGGTENIARFRSNYGI